MDKFYQVFVSSTYSDLREERRRVSETLAKAGFITAGMELFPATDQQQLEFIKRIIDRCDYYVVIVGGRYGSLADENISFTEKEYEYALSNKIPVLAFLHGNPEKIEVGKTDQDMDKALKLRRFRERLASGRLVDYWSDPQDLCTKVVIAVVQSVNLMPGIGWIRGDQAIDPRVVQDFEKLRTENEKLKLELRELDPEGIAFPSNLPSPDEPFEVTFYLGGWREPSPRSPGTRYKTTWKDFFLEASDRILREQNETLIADHVIELFAGSQNVSIDSNDLRTVRTQLEALGLIRAISKTRPNDGHVFLAWSMTDKGRRYLSEQKALKRKEASA